MKIFEGFIGTLQKCGTVGYGGTTSSVSSDSPTISHLSLSLSLFILILYTLHLKQGKCLWKSRAGMSNKHDAELKTEKSDTFKVETRLHCDDV